MTLTKEELSETIENLQVKPMHHNILILVPLIAEETETGIIKGDAIMKEEQDNLSKDAFLTVIAVADDVTTIVVGDKVYCQGTILTFNPETMPAEIDVAPIGYTVGSVLDMYVKMKI